MAALKNRVLHQTGHVLHTLPYRETSLIIEAFTREHGRVALMAKGARRPHSSLRGVIMEFLPLEFSWSGQGELKTLTHCEWLGGQALLRGRALMFAYYMNELLLRLLPREDAHPALFDHYAATLAALSIQADAADEVLLRRFEHALLRELGYGLHIEHCADSDESIQPVRHYHYEIERGLIHADLRQGAEDGRLYISGRTLIALQADDYSEAETRQQSKQLMRMLLNHYLNGQPLQARRVFKELQEL